MFRVLRRLKHLVRRNADDRDLREELAAHLAIDEQERIEAGAAPHVARVEARRDFGNGLRVTEDTRDVWGWRRVEQLARDIRGGLRHLRRNPGFSAVAILTLALGIGGVTATFSAFDAILVRPLPYTDADRLVMVWDAMGQSDVVSKQSPSPAEWLEWRRLNTVFTDIAATQPGDAVISGDANPEQVPARRATANLWRVLGVTPAVGRVFTEEEDTAGARVALISHGLWQRRYAGSPDVVGRTITLNDHSYVVVGVLPRGFFFMPSREIDVWMPASFPDWMRTNLGWLDAQVVARLKPGVTREQAEQSMSALNLRVTAALAKPRVTSVRPLREDLAGDTRAALIVLLGASAVLLLIACVNLANLLMSSGEARRREVAVRTALGAGRGTLVAQFLTEGLVLAAIGGAIGLGLALPAMRFLDALVPDTMNATRLTLDWRVLAFTAAMAVAATVVFALVPALRGTQVSPHERLRDGGRGSTGPRSRWVQHALVVVETALAVLLLTSGGLLLETLQRLRHTEMGLESRNLLTFETALYRYPTFEKRVAFVNDAVERLRAIPGVLDAAAVSRIPLTETAQATFYWLAGQPRDRIADQVALFRVITRGYFETVGATLRDGRAFDISERRSDAPAAIVNESFADRHFSGRSAIGARFKFGDTGDKGYWYTIIGVVKDVRDRGVAEEFRPTVYLLHEQTDQWSTQGAQPGGFVLRTAGDAASIVPAIRQAILSVDQSQPVWRVQTLQDIVDRQLSTPRQSTTLLGAIALLALVLASIGLYGVLSYAVTQRREEIGVRMALGATSGRILRHFVVQGFALTTTGLVLGSVLAAVAARSMSALLYGVRPDYLPIVVAVSVLLLAVASLACMVPARRASRIDPAIALRNE